MADIFNLTDTWNNAGTTFNAIKMNVTNTASAADSKIMDLQVGSASKLSLTPGGVVTATLSGDLAYAIDVGGGQPIVGIGRNGIVGGLNLSGNGITGWTAVVTSEGVVSGGYFGFATNVNQGVDIRLYRDAAATLAQRNSTNAQTLRVYNTYTDAANYERGGLSWAKIANTFTIGAENAGTGTGRKTVIFGGETSSATNGRVEIGCAGALPAFSGGPSLIILGPGGTPAFLFMHANSNTLSIEDTGNGAEFKLAYASPGGMQMLPSVGLRLANSNSVRWSSDNFAYGTPDAALSRSAAGVVEVNNGTAGTGAALKVATLRRNPPVTKTADFAVADTDSYIICNKGSAGVITLPAAASYPGREISFTNIQAFAWTSASANVVPRVGGSAANAILAATDGAWCKLVSDGTNWINLQGTP